MKLFLKVITKNSLDDVLITRKLMIPQSSGIFNPFKLYDFGHRLNKLYIIL